MTSDPKADRALTFSCPIPISQYPQVLLAHGGGGQLMHQLIERMFLPTFGGDHLASRHDGARLDIAGARLAFTTDSYVVQPLFFPGGGAGIPKEGKVTLNRRKICQNNSIYLKKPWKN